MAARSDANIGSPLLLVLLVSLDELEGFCVDFWDIEKTGTAELLGVFESGSEDWHAARSGHVVTGSTIGAVMGCNPWESPVTRFYKAAGRISDTVEPNVSMRIGSLIEQPLLDLFQEQHPELTVYKTGTWVSKANPAFLANPDAIFVDADGVPGIIEVKFARSYWSEGVPLHYQMQLNWYLGLLGFKHGRFVALAGSTWTDLPYEFDQFLFDAQLVAAEDFLHRLATDRVPDWDGAANTLDTVRKLNPDIDGSEVELGHLGLEYLELSKQMVELESDLNATKSEMLAWLGSAKYGLYAGQRIVARQSRGGGVPYLVNVKG
jgi:predicted phage-related endonuclease